MNFVHMRREIFTHLCFSAYIYSNICDLQRRIAEPRLQVPERNLRAKTPRRAKRWLGRSSLCHHWDPFNISLQCWSGNFRHSWTRDPWESRMTPTQQVVTPPSTFKHDQKEINATERKLLIRRDNRQCIKATEEISLRICWNVNKWSYNVEKVKILQLPE